MKRSREPFFWAMFSAGGMLAALVLPAYVFVTAFAIPLGWVEAPAREALLDLVRQPLARLGLFALVLLSLFHWAHRFRYTLYDGLQLYHLNLLIAVVCYGGATVLSLAGAWILWSVG